MKVRDLMSSAVVTVAPDELASVAARILARYNVGSVPVCDRDGRVHGLLTDRDIVLRCVAAEKEPAKTQVREIMTSRVISAAPDEEAETAARRTAEEQVRRLPVIENGRLAGVLSLGDLSVNGRMAMEASACLTDICRNVRRR